MPDQKQSNKQNNLRLALILASVACAFALGYVAKIALFGY
jgi:hypothetical protein